MMPTDLSVFKSPITQDPEPSMFDVIMGRRGGGWAEETLLWEPLNQKHRLERSLQEEVGRVSQRGCCPQQVRLEEGPSGEREVKGGSAWKRLLTLSTRAKRDE